MKKRVLSHILAVALIILVSSFMPLFLFFTNIDSIRFIEILVFMGTFSGIGLILFTILRLTTKSEYKAATITAVVTLIYQNIGRLQELIGDWFVLLLFVVLMVGIGILAKKFLSEEIAKIFTPILTIMLTLLCVLNTVTSLGKITDKVHLGSDVEIELDERYDYIKSFRTENTESEELPNVYFFIPDEYAGFASAEKFLGYDNKEFKTFLEENNFSISTSSTNYSNGTLECLADVFNLEINTNNRYRTEGEGYCQEKVNHGLIFRMAEDLGYSIRAFQPNDLIGYKSETSQYGKMWSTTADGDLSVELMLEPTIIYPIKDAFSSLMKKVTPETSVASGVTNKLGTSNAEPLVYFTKDKATYPEATFNVCYSLIPHQPFYFNADGSFVKDDSHLNDWSSKEYYLEQFKYSTKLLTESVENIIENDPNSIIIIMSDHGMRTHAEGEAWMNEMTPKDNADIICAVYYKGEQKLDIEGLCGANVLITTINEAYGYEIPLLEQSDSYYFK